MIIYRCGQFDCGRTNFLIVIPTGYFAVIKIKYQVVKIHFIINYFLDRN